MSSYDNFDPIATDGGKFIRFETEGDSCGGVVTAIGSKTFTGDSQAHPEITFVNADGEEKVVTASNTSLHNLVLSARPEKGEAFKATFTHKSGQAKIYELQVWDADQNLRFPGGEAPVAKAEEAHPTATEEKPPWES